MILLAAGNGDLSKGFENVLDLYHHVHNEGFRPGMELNSLQIGRETNEQPQWRGIYKGRHKGINREQIG
jgi:hypothetical protein